MASVASPAGEPTLKRLSSELASASYGIRGGIAAQRGDRPVKTHSIHVKFDEFTGHGEDYPLTDVGHPVGRPLQIVRGPKQIVAAID